MPSPGRVSELLGDQIHPRLRLGVCHNSRALEKRSVSRRWILELIFARLVLS